MLTKEQAYQKIAELVQRFEEQYDSYKQADYNETLTRRDFIDPFFKALGWDIDNEQGAAESYREVIHEDKIKIGRTTKAPDYSFRLGGGKRLFFVEAKKPSVAIKDAIQPAFQVRRYGWNKGLAISIITDFEEFSVYDCTKKPFATDKASRARLKYLTFRDYLNEFDFLWGTFSKEQVLKGGLDKYAQSNIQKRGTETVDKDFLQSLDNWRTYLATSIANNNKNLDEDEINFVVQQIIDRIIFLRIAEDRSIEPYENLKKCLAPTIYKGEGASYRELFKLFIQADDKYNSGLFDFKKDRISEHLKVDNKVIKNILNELYDPCPYVFDVMPVEILGTAYEQFLGKVIRITAAHHAKIEEKPEVRKAGGVYYTPQYIVEYIVKNTVGKLAPLNLPKGEKQVTPKDVAKIKIVDPACGSGSFLIGAYQYLLDWHLQYYLNYPADAKKEKALTPSPLGRVGEGLTTDIKKRILLNNIYGVDIDVNAVEVTKLSLLLKCMEGETEASINHQLKFFHERVLPTLDNNIKSGNSLIDENFWDGEFELGFDKKIKPFSWEKAFPEVFKKRMRESNKDLKRHFNEVMSQADEADKLIEKYQNRVEEPVVYYGKMMNGGFDVVIGNPPYRTLQLGKKQKSQEKDLLDYYQKNYPASFEYKLNLYSLFIERSIALLVENGMFSFIVPNTFYNTISFKSIRKFMLEKGGFNSVMDLRYKVFEEAELGGSAVFVYEKSNEIKHTDILTVKSIEGFVNPETNKISTKDFLSDADYNLIISQDGNEIIKTIEKQNGIVELGSITKIYQGIITGDNKKYLSEKAVNSKWKPILKGRNINRYSLKFNDTYVYYSPEDLWSNTNEKMFKVPAKIISRQTSDKLVATLDTEGYFSLDSTHVIHLLNETIDIKYLLGIYNSKLLNYLYQSRVQEGGRVFAQVKTVNLKPLPIKLIDKKNKSEKSHHDEIVKNVDLLLKLNEEKQETKLQSKIEQLQSHIEYCEEQINKAVYELYDLTPEEIDIVKYSIK